MVRIAQVALFSSLAFVSFASLYADDANSMVGKQVMPKKLSSMVGASNDAAAGVWNGQSPQLIVTVLDQKGDWLLVRRGSVTGWYQHGDVVALQDAIPYFTDLIHADPKNAMAYAARGAAWRVKRIWEQSLKDCSRAIDLQPQMSLWHRNRGDVFRARDEHEKAISDYTEALKRDPNDTQSYINRGIVYRAKQEYQKALDDYAKAEALDSKDADLYNNRGMIYRARREYAKSIKEYDTAIQLAPREVAPYFNRGNDYFELHEYDKAIQDYDAAIQLRPKNAIFYANRAAAYCGSKSYEKALADCEKAIEIDSKFSRAYNTRGDALRALRKYEEALDNLKKAVQYDPKYSTAHANLAWLYATSPDARMRNGTLAKEHAQHAIDLSEDPFNLAAYAAAAAENKDFKTAISYQKKAMKSSKHANDLMQHILELYEKSMPYRESR